MPSIAIGAEVAASAAAKLAATRREELAERQPTDRQGMNLDEFRAFLAQRQAMRESVSIASEVPPAKVEPVKAPEQPKPGQRKLRID